MYYRNISMIEKQDTLQLLTTHVDALDRTMHQYCPTKI